MEFSTWFMFEVNFTPGSFFFCHMTHISEYWIVNDLVVHLLFLKLGLFPGIMHLFCSWLFSSVTKLSYLSVIWNFKLKLSIVNWSNINIIVCFNVQWTLHPFIFQSKKIYTVLVWCRVLAFLVVSTPDTY